MRDGFVSKIAAILRRIMKWFEKYSEKLAHRKNTVEKALELLLKQPGRIMVETGTIRQYDDWGAGMSSLVYGDFAKEHGFHFFTVDIMSGNIELCKEITKDYSDVITYVINDSIAFLQTFNQTIDFLYLDSMDCPEYDAEDSPVLMRSQNHQLEEFKAAENKLSQNAVVLLDDCRFTNGGKCGLTKPYLKSQGWTCVLEEYQSLWTR